MFDGTCTLGPDPCNGQACLDGLGNPGTCIVDPDQPVTQAVCDCNGSYYHDTDPLSCTMCDASSFVCGSCPAEYTGANCDCHAAPDADTDRAYRANRADGTDGSNRANRTDGSNRSRSDRNPH